jgi:hypothetical protein
MNWRDTKNVARRQVHDTMRVAALYCVANPAYVDETNTPDECRYFTESVSVRVHTDYKPLGDLKGTSFHYSEKQEVAPRIIFWRDELDTPVRGAIVSISDEEMYNIDNTLPVDGPTVTCEATRVLKRQMEGVPFPGV